MGVENIVAGNGVGIAITGMLVVVVGLVLISGFIALLPKAFEWVDGARAKRRGVGTETGAPAGASSDPLGLDPDLVVAIGYVIEAERERERSQDRQRITMREDGEQSVWTAIGKMRTLSTRL